MWFPGFRERLDYEAILNQMSCAILLKFKGSGIQVKSKYKPRFQFMYILIKFYGYFIFLCTQKFIYLKPLLTTGRLENWNEPIKSKPTH